MPSVPNISSSPSISGPGVLYLQVKRELLRRIETHQWRPGQALPNERTLATELQVSIGTLRRAVDELVHEHVLVRHQGKGTFVKLHSKDRYLFQFFRVQAHEDWSHLGLKAAPEYPQVQCLSFERQRSDEVSAGALRLREGDPIFVIHNRLSLSGRPVVLDRIVISASLFKGMTEKRFRERENTIYNLYQTDFGITVLHTQERARAVLATREAMRHLGVTNGAPLLEVQRLALSFGERPVELRTSLIASQRHDYVTDVTRNE
ncbi:MAG: GntR family transcriptional regulator [Curvibacter sp. GWA2_64_110]|nr:MAG: GntR family transcriptional regulator [Curvibacter sp. GWA2_64_110]HCY14962.1 GntR family transcriptional regulator [Curvibacter sp.]